MKWELSGTELSIGAANEKRHVVALPAATLAFTVDVKEKDFVVEGVF